MALTLCPVVGKKKSADLCAAFAMRAPATAEGYVFFGVNETNYDVWRSVRRKGLPFYYIDNSYFDAARGEQYRVTRNAVQMPADRIREARSDGARFAALGCEIKPWFDAREGHWLVVEQSPGFMKLVAEHATWLTQTVNEVKRSSAHPVKFRSWDPDKLKVQASLPADLVGARTVVTHSSAAAITGALAGVPFLVSPMSAIYSMQPFERLHFVQVLADNQWSIDELRAGNAWEALQE